MYQFSDSESADSDKGIRYKTESTRYKTDVDRNKDSSHREKRHKDRSSSPKHYSRSDKIHHSTKIKDRRKWESSSENDHRHSNHSRRHKGDREEDRYKFRRHRDKDYDRSSKKGSERRNIKDETRSETSVTSIYVKVNDKDNYNEIVAPIDKISSRKISEKNSASTSPSADSFGPALPPHLQKSPSKFENRDACIIENINIDQNEERSPNTPEGPFRSCIGPLSSPQMKGLELEEAMNASVSEQCVQNKTDDNGEVDAVIVGPILPPHMQTKNYKDNTNDVDHTAIVGPILPPDLKKQLEKTNSAEAHQIPSHYLQDTPEDLNTTTIGPQLPPHLREKLLEAATESSEVREMDDSEEEVYGPLPIDANLTKAHIELEERALQMRIDQLNPKQNEPTREEWMLELPAAKASNFGLGPRQFRTKAGPDLSDRSSWTDTPQDKARKKLKSEEKVDIRKEAELQALKDRDKEQEAIIKRSKRATESLIDIHTKKKKLKDKTGPAERRPFSREVDLQVNKFDEAQKKAVLKKAQLLDTRFSSGESKFL